MKILKKWSTNVLIKDDSDKKSVQVLEYFKEFIRAFIKTFNVCWLMPKSIIEDIRQNIWFISGKVVIVG
ncbi:hypothetical protein HYE29_02480 [Mycoplasmopsis bovis]|nr:hypothetical protein [Mycoplasmopsis bovis]QQH22810.1 hypothetical protein HYE29_02480 [Mycoplasmopsis bovis]